MTKCCGTLESMITMEEQAEGRGKSVHPVWSHVVGTGEKILYQVVGKVCSQSQDLKENREWILCLPREVRFMHSAQQGL